MLICKTIISSFYQLLCLLFILAVQISLNQSSYSVNEEDREIEVCATLTGQLDRSVVVELFTMSDTADANDYNSGSVLYTFTMSDETVCKALGISNDSVVENTENFILELLVNPDDSAVIVNLSMAVVFINDSSIDCKSDIPDK